MTKQEIKQLQNIHKKIKEIAMDLDETHHVGEIEYNSKRLMLEADRLGNVIEVSGSGTGDN
jgi:hypothetical protein